MTNRLSRPAILPHRNGDGIELAGVEIILNYLRERYRPDFRRGNAIHSDSGEIVHQNAACSAPTSVLIARLESASDAPRFPAASGGGIKRDQLPGFFKKWVSVAWGDLLTELPDEDGAALGIDSMAADEFQRLVRDAMLSEIVLGDVIDGTTVTQTERRSLIDWCVKFAKPGPWRSIRSKKCWCKCEVTERGVFILHVAIRAELFGQLRADRLLCSMNQNTFTRRAARYGVGSSNRDDRPHGLAAVVLDDAFVASLTTGISDPPNLADQELADSTDGPDQETDPAEWTQTQ